MKSRQLLSIVFSLIMFTGVTAGSAAFAESDEYYDELANQLEDFCFMTEDEQSDFFSDNPDMAEYDEKLAIICEIEDEEERYDELNNFIDAVVNETRDVDFDDEFDELEDEYDNVIEDFEDCVEAGYPIMESFPEQCMTEDGTVFVNDKDDRHDDYRKDKLHDKDIREMVDRYCEMSDEDKRAFVAEHDKAADHVEKMNTYCSLDESERDAYVDEYIDKYSDKGPGNLRDHFAMYCDMTPEKRAEKMQMHSDLPGDLRDKFARYCEMSEDEQDELRDSMMDKMDEFKDHMKDKMTDKHMDYDRYCSMASSDRLAEITDLAKYDEVSKWCDMTPEERDEYKHEHHDSMKDKVTDKHHENMMKFSDESKRLKAMIMEKHDISDERMDEIKMKFKEKHGDITDEKKSELKMKFKDHMAKIKVKMTDERKSEIHDRLAEMKEFKAELREKSSDMTDEQKQELREAFIEKAKDLQLAWISPRTQMTAGIDAAEVECREGFSLVMKASNGVAMCLKADTALKMIDRGIVVPAI